MQYATIATARQLIDAGAVRAVEVIGHPGGWAIVLRIGAGEAVIQTDRGEVRLWARLDTVRAQLEAFGVRRFAVDGTHLAPGLKL